MVDVRVTVPEDRLAQLYAKLAAWLSEDEEVSSPAEPWTDEAAREALRRAREPERDLLRRLIAARSVRVPLSELSRDLGLPSVASPEQDFPGITAFCASEEGKRHAMP